MEIWAYTFRPLKKSTRITFGDQPHFVLPKGTNSLSCIINDIYFELRPPKQKYEEKRKWEYDIACLSQLEHWIQGLEGSDIKLVQIDSPHGNPPIKNHRRITFNTLYSKKRE